MKTLQVAFPALVIAAIGGVALASTTSARADTISIGICEGTAITCGAPGDFTTVQSGGSPQIYSATNPAAAPDYTISVTGTGTPPLAEPNLRTATVDAQSLGSGTNNLFVAITETGITSTSPSFLSGFTSNAQSAISTSLETLISTSNALYTGTVLNSATFGPSALLQTASGSNAGTSTIPYSLTALYQVTTSASGQNADLTITLQPVPLPGALPLFGSALVGLGALYRRKRRNQGQASSSLPA